MRPCFAFSAKTATKPAVLAIDDDIGFWGVQARDFRAALDAVEGNELTVEVNSAGGDVMAGLGMYNMLRNSGKTITTRVTGVAASIASIVMLAGDKREMPSNAFAMVHSVKSGAFGTEEELHEQADVVGKVQASLRNIYVARMGIDEDKAKEIMAKDTWLTAEECLEMGFVTAIVDPVKATAKFDLARADLPVHVAKIFTAKAEEAAAQAEDDVANLEAAEAATAAAAAAAEAATATATATATAAAEAATEAAAVPKTPVAEQIVLEAKAVGLETHASFFALSCTSLDDAKARMSQAREIVALCVIAGTPTAATAHIRAGTKVADVRAALVEALDKEDTPVDNAPRNKTTGQTNGDPAKPAAVTPTSLWASHDSQTTKGR